jgi:hypothetical protein
MNNIKFQLLVFYIIVAIHILTLGYGIYSNENKIVLLSCSMIVAFVSIILIYKYEPKEK